MHRHDKGAGAYLLRLSACVSPVHRVFCFPPAGVGAASFLGWRPLFSPGFELIAIQLPGRENRLREALCSDLCVVIADIVAEMQPLMDRPASFFGHSFGALLAYECCNALRRAGLPGPAHLVVSGANPPNWPLSVNAEDIGELALARLSERLGWTCAEDVDEAITALALQVLSADLDMMLRHRFSEDRLAMPLTVIGATDDPIVSVEALQHWTAFAPSHELSLTTGGHFFFEAHKARIAELLQAHAARLHPLPRPPA